MAKCPSCDALLKEGDWTCGVCGVPTTGMAAAPSAAGSPAAYGGPGGSSGDYAGAPPSQEAYLPEYRTQPAAAPAKAGASGGLRLVLILGLMAIVAVIAVWFFALRGPSTTGDEFVGTWTSTTKSGIATTGIVKNDDAFTVTLSGSGQKQEVAVPAHLDGKELVITLDDFSKMAGEDNADQIKDALKALAGDFRMVFSSVTPDNLSLRIVGTSPSGQDYDQTFPMAKGTAATP